MPVFDVKDTGIAYTNTACSFWDTCREIGVICPLLVISEARVSYSLLHVL